MGHPEAPNSIGGMFLQGLGVRQDLAEAVRWYQKGVDRGDGWAAINLGDLHRSGTAVKQDHAQAAIAYARAAVFYSNDAAKLARTRLQGLGPQAKVEALRQVLANWIEKLSKRVTSLL